VAVKRLGQRRALLATLVFAGLRISEALALRWRDVDLARGEIVVSTSKTDAGIRRVRILPVLRDELLSLRARLDRRSRRRWSSRPRRAAARASATSAAAYC
jgi:integrase